MRQALLHSLLQGCRGSCREGPRAARGGKGRQLAPIPLYRPETWATGILKNGTPAVRFQNLPRMELQEELSPRGGTLFWVPHSLLVGPVWGPWGFSRLGWMAGDKVACQGWCLGQSSGLSQVGTEEGLTMLSVALSQGLRLRYFRCRS